MQTSTELRWFGEGELPPAALRTFLGNDELVVEFRVDDYFAQSSTFGLKVRAGDKVELKQRNDSHRVTCGDDGCAGYLQQWEKWALPFTGTVPQEMRDDRSWITTAKTRRIRKYILSEGSVHEVTARVETGCGLEMVNLLIGPDGRKVWTIGLEAFGDPSERESLLLKLAEQFLSPSMLGLSLNDANSHSYPGWLTRTP